MTHVVCVLNTETVADRATFTWSEGPASFEPYTMDGMVYQEFKEIAAEAREKLADLVTDYLLDEQRMPASAFALAEAGHELYQAMFRPGAAQARQAKQVRNWLEELAAQDEVDTLEIVVESPWSLSWNIIYDREPDEAAFLSGDDNPDRWKPFWGLRYNLAGGRKVDPLRRMPVLKDPKVLMVVDREIRDGLPEDQQERLNEFVESRNFKMVCSKDQLQQAVKLERPDLLYWLSHANADELVLAGEPISPRNMRKLLRQDDDVNFGGLAFLNACQTAERGKSSSFFEAFHEVGFAGMIGTEHQTVDQFANPLGLDFLEAFLDRGEPVGSVLRKLRGRVPLGLLYGTYCPPDIRVDRGDVRDGLAISQVHVQGVALSSTLSPGLAAAALPPPLPDEPYPSLAYYERKDRALFAGRDDDIERFATYLDDASTRILMLHGESGVGKSSFLNAGVIPYLEEECLGYRFIRNQDGDGSKQAKNSILFVRATNDLFGQLAQALWGFCSEAYEYQTPLHETISVNLPEILAELLPPLDSTDLKFANRRGTNWKHGPAHCLQEDPSLLSRILSAINDRLPFTAILVIDQGEEVFTLAKTAEEQERGRVALDALRLTAEASGNFKIIFAFRTEYCGRVIDRLRRGLHDTRSIREYLLTDFDQQGLVEAIRRPTSTQLIRYSSEIPREKYRFRYDDDVPEEIARRVITHGVGQRRGGVLPLAQVVCGYLYERVRDRGDHVVTMDDLDQLGGVEGGMQKHVEAMLHRLTRENLGDKKCFKKLLAQLYLRQSDGSLTTALLSEEDLSVRWQGRQPFPQMLAKAVELRLLRVASLRIGGQDERCYVSLGHDSLANIAADWDAEFSRGVRLLKLLLTVASVLAVVFLATAAWSLKERNIAEKEKTAAVTAYANLVEAKRIALAERSIAESGSTLALIVLLNKEDKESAHIAKKVLIIQTLGQVVFAESPDAWEASCENWRLLEADLRAEPSWFTTYFFPKHQARIDLLTKSQESGRTHRKELLKVSQELKPWVFPKLREMSKVKARYYRQAQRTASALSAAAAADKNFADVAPISDLFWRLYLGEMVLIENQTSESGMKSVETSMVAFGGALEDWENRGGKAAPDLQKRMGTALEKLKRSCDADLEQKSAQH